MEATPSNHHGHDKKDLRKDYRSLSILEFLQKTS